MTQNCFLALFLIKSYFLDVNGVKVVCVLCQTVFVYKASKPSTVPVSTSILKPKQLSPLPSMQQPGLPADSTVDHELMEHEQETETAEMAPVRLQISPSLQQRTLTTSSNNRQRSEISNNAQPQVEAFSFLSFQCNYF